MLPLVESVPAVVELAQTGAEQVGGVVEGIAARFHTGISSAAVDLLSDKGSRTAARTIVAGRWGRSEVENVVDTM